MTKIRATIDIDNADELISELTSMERGSYGCDEHGAYYMFYGSRNDLVIFEDVEFIDGEDVTSKQWHDKNCTLCKSDD